MKSVSRIALGAVLALSGSAMLFASPADAQRRNRQQAEQAPAATPGQRQFNPTRQERPLLVALETAAGATDVNAQNAALAAAEAGVSSADGRYLLGGLQLRLGSQRSDNALMSRGVENLIGSGVATVDEMPNFLGVQATVASALGDHARAERALTELTRLQPNNAQALVNLATIRSRAGNAAGTVEALRRAIALGKAAGQRSDENWHKVAVRTAYDSRDPALRAQSVAIARDWVAEYPTAENWRDALLIYREVSQPDAQHSLDIYRLARNAGALNGERDFGVFADLLSSGGYPAEAKAVLDEGVSRRMIQATEEPFRNLLAVNSGRIASDRAELAGSQRDALAAATGTPALRTADAFYGHGRYADAIALYRAALQKGGVDANLVNTRLGMALAAAGNRAEAEAAFRAVTGPRAELAQFWLLWLSQRPAA